MGVSVRGFETVTPIEDHLSSKLWCPHVDEDSFGGHQQAYVYECFEASAAGLELGFTDKGSGIRFGRCYNLAGRTDSVDQSYGGYGWFRKHLCQAALGVKPAKVWKNQEQYSDSPFYLMINFADNEWDGHNGFDSEYITQLYDGFSRVFHLAADTGVVVYS